LGNKDLKLKRPLYKSQIEAALRLHNNLNEWTDSERILDTITCKFPKFDKDSILIKSVILNTLYSTNVFAITRMSEHIYNLIKKSDVKKAGAELVEKIACLPKTKEQVTDRRFHSFAAKFAHFFIDFEKFPILDSYAEWMLKYHLGRKLYRADREKRYHAFLENLNKLREISQIDSPYKEIDHYLWIAGEYHKWRNNHNAPINAMLKELFSNPSRNAEMNLRRLTAI
jgi:hypothetical protein